MDDRELGRAIEDAVWPGAAFRWPDDICVQLGAAARALLVKPVAMREAVKTLVWAQLPHPLKCPNSQGMIYGGEIEDVIADIVLAALSHFAPPARPKMMIQGMSVDDLQMAMQKAEDDFGHGNAVPRAAAEEAHRLANTPAPEVDPDAEAKALWEIMRATIKQAGEGCGEWDNLPTSSKNGWRAVAAAKKEAGGE